MEATAMDERWGFLLPWCSPLRGRLWVDYTQLHGVPSQKYSSLLVQLPVGGSPAALAAVRAAVLLLAVVDRVDHGAWRYMLQEYCDLDVANHREAFESEDFRARFLLALSESSTVDSRWAATVLSDFFAGIYGTPDDEFVRVVQRVLALETRQTTGKVEIPVAVSVRPGSLTEELTERMLYQHVRGIWNSIVALKSSYGGFRIPVLLADGLDGVTILECEFRVGPVQVDVKEHLLTPEIASLSLDMARMSDELPFAKVLFNITPDDSTVSSPLVDASTAASFLSGVLLLGVDQLSRTEFQDVHLDCSSAALPTFAKLCSAVAETRSTTKLSLSVEFAMNLSPETRTWMWQRLAYALFSKHAHSSIKDITITGVSMSVDDAEAIRAVLTADDPTALLFGDFLMEDVDVDNRDGLGQHERPQCLFVLNKGTVIELLRMLPEDSKFIPGIRLVLQMDVHGVKLLHDHRESNEVKVLVPGYGVCRIRRDQLNLLQHAHQFPATTVTSLTIHFDTSTGLVSGLPRFCELVGSSLEYLCVQVDEFDPRDETPRQLQLSDFLMWCGNLKALSISWSRISSASLIQTIRDGNLQYLTRLECQLFDIQVITGELSNPESHLAKNLTHLSYVWPSLTPPRLELGRYAAIADMLAVNRRLEYLSLVVHSESFEMATSSMRGYDDVKFAVARAPFPVRSRLALLSVLQLPDQAVNRQPIQTSLAPSNRQQQHQRSVVMDRHVLSIIYSFAAPCVHRRLFVRREFGH